MAWKIGRLAPKILVQVTNRLQRCPQSDMLMRQCMCACLSTSVKLSVKWFFLQCASQLFESPLESQPMCLLVESSKEVNIKTSIQVLNLRRLSYILNSMLGRQVLYGENVGPSVHISIYCKQKFHERCSRNLRANVQIEILLAQENWATQQRFQDLPNCFLNLLNIERC